jgi:PKD repeat protein
VSDEAYANANWSGGIDEGAIFSELGCNVYIPDANFKTALVENTAINTNGDAEIQYGEAEAYTGSIAVENLGIADMTGLQTFKLATTLDCSQNNLRQLVVQANTSLETLDCSSNQINALDMKANLAIESFNCSSNQLLQLDLRNGQNSQITSFDARNNPLLTCISVDDANYSSENWTNIEAHTSFSSDCNFLAVFEADVTSGSLPLSVQFTDRSDNGATSWLWDFGDGNTSSDQSPIHTYTAAGSYTVSLTISDGSNNDVESKPDFIVVEKADQSISFEPLASKAFGDADFELSATSSSGLAVSYASSDLSVATIDGSTVTLVGVGTTSITASQAGNDNYNAAPDVSQTLTIEKADQTITFADIPDQPLRNGQLVLTATASSGLDVSYTISEGPATVDGSTVTFTGVGTVTVLASQEGDANYHPADPVTQSFDIFEITALDVDEDANLLLYPNPASNMIVVEFSADIHRVRMLNLNGQTVYEKQGIDKLAGMLEIDTSPYPPGEYIIRLEGEDSVVSRKVILSR